MQPFRFIQAIKHSRFMQNHRWVLLLVMVLLASSVFWLMQQPQSQLPKTILELPNYLASFQAFQQQNPIAFAFIFTAIYIVAVAMSLPGAALLTLAAGAMLGLWWGVLVVSFASTLGATLAFLMSRYFLRDAISHRFANKLEGFEAAFAKDGAFYLFTLRMVPIFPFVLINILMGLTSIRIWTFYWVSQLGMLAATVVYVNAGTQLNRITSLNDVASPWVWGSFAMLGILPYVARQFMNALQQKRMDKHWNKPKQFDNNIVLIGAGAAGLVTAYIAAASKAKVTLIEANEMGGDCLNYGCVPSKAIIACAKMAHDVQHSQRYGIKTSVAHVHFPSVMQYVDEAIKKIAPHDSIERYTELGVQVIKGRATLLSPWHVCVQHADGTETRHTTKNIVLATGAKPIMPKIPGINKVQALSSDTLWQQLRNHTHAPKRLLVLGGGAMGCELAQAMARLGSKVVLIESAVRLMPHEDEDVSHIIQMQFQSEGIEVLTQHTVLAFDVTHEKHAMVRNAEGVEQKIVFDELLCAMGRKADFSGLGLEALGLLPNAEHAEEQSLHINAFLQTQYPNIYVAGDAAGPYRFTHMAAHQAWYVAINALFGNIKRFKPKYIHVPSVSYTSPEVARIGLNENQAKTKGIAYETTTFSLENMDRAVVDGHNVGWIKVLTPPNQDKILGVSIVSPHASELLTEWLVAMQHGLGLKKLLATIHPYPTYSEANKKVAGMWQQKHVPQKALNFAQWFHRWMRGG